jgi:diguanylate cyclase (GGDEF)-like protein
MTEVGALRRGAALGLSLLVIVCGILAVSVVGFDNRLLDPPFTVPWFAVAVLYLLTLRFTLDFEFRGEARSIVLSHMPLALGGAFLAPGAHLLARGLAALTFSVLVSRHPPVKTAFNTAACVAEVALFVTISHALQPMHTPGLSLWVALLASALIGDIVCSTLLSVTFRLLRIPGSPWHWTSFATACLAALMMTSVGFVAVAALWTEPLTGLVLALVAAGMTLGWRTHRRLAAQQQTTADLYAFVKSLGPIRIDEASTREILDEVRVLLSSRHLDLALAPANGSRVWRHLTSSEPGDSAAVADPVQPPDVALHSVQTAERMSVPLVGARGFLGLLTVNERLGKVRDFDLGDLRLIETVGNELATALERGRLLNDLERAATTDSLTGLPNLADVTARIDAQLADQRQVVVAAIAVDSFREVNDTLGHEVGDELLLEVTRRLLVSHPDATVGRIGGGRFAVAVPASQVGGDASMFGLGIRAQVEGGAQLGPIGTHVRLSVGCVSAPDHGNDAATLIRRAETAMYSARHAHGGPVLWEPAYEVQGTRRLAVVMALREALSSGAIGVAFQPKLDARTRTVTGVEALARWTHPALGAISPDEFIPLAEASGLMGPLTSTVLRQALTSCKGWQRRGGRIGIAVNVSAGTVLDAGFVTEVAALLTSTNVSPDLLTLELTEGVLVDDPKLAAERMSELRALGVKLSVDDFGTGYSSLTYLKGLPVDEVKVDKGFVDDILDDAGDRAVVRAVVDIAHTLGLRVVAEGVEQEEQHQVLAELGVDEIQGFLHARPMAALDMAGWLRRREQQAQTTG